MVVAQEGYQPLDADCEPYVRHGRDGLPAVLSRGMYLLSSPTARRPGVLFVSIKNAVIVLLSNECVWNVFSMLGMECSVTIEAFEEDANGFERISLIATDSARFSGQRCNVCPD